MAEAETVAPASLLGHARVRQAFERALNSGRLAHAWLLYGAKGIGKRCLAERLAMLALCETNTGCGACHPCRLFVAGSHPDVFHAALIEGKRDISIEQVRDVLEFLSLSGAKGQRRIVILDDAERMNHQAANALLKGLEEPAAGNLLLIVCSDLERLPATIRSRCLLQHCAPLAEAEVRQVLEAMGIDAAYMPLALRLADGAPGRVECMCDSNVAEALADWQRLLADLAQADIGELEAWIRKHVATMPHELIVQLIGVTQFEALALQQQDFAAGEQAMRAMMDCLAWPRDVMRHGLRPAISLLARVLALRAALRAKPRAGRA